MAKKCIAFLLALAMLLSFAACASGEEEAPQGSGSPGESSEAENNGESKESLSGSVTMWTFLDVNADNGRSKVLKKLIEHFEKENSGAAITVETQEWTTMSAKIIAGHAAGSCPDIFMINMANLGEAIASGCMEPLENLFYDDWTDEQKADIDNELFRAGCDGTYHYEIPLFSGTFGIMYRKDLFEEFGIKAEDIKTWEDLVKAAQTLTYVNDAGLQVWGYGVGYATDVTDPHGVLPTVLFSQEGGIFNEDGTPNDWSGEQGQAGLQFQIDLIDKYKVTPEACVAKTSEEIYNDFEAGQYAMISGGSVRVPTVKGLTAFDPDDVGFMAYPAWNEGEEHSIANAYSWNTAVWSGSQVKETAGAFLEYLVSPEADKLWCTEAQQIPVLNSTLESCAEFIDTPDNEFMITTSDIYANSALVIAKKDTYKTFADLKGKRIGMENGTTHQKYLQDKHPEVKTVAYDSYQNAIIDLKNGRIDGVFGDTAVVNEWLKTNPQLGVATDKVTDPQYFGTGLGIAVRPDNKALLEKLNSALAAIKADGTYQKISDQWFPQ